jgi:hypothetical protein
MTPGRAVYTQQNVQQLYKSLNKRLIDKKMVLVCQNKNSPIKDYKKEQSRSI